MHFLVLGLQHSGMVFDHLARVKVELFIFRWEYLLGGISILLPLR